MSQDRGSINLLLALIVFALIGAFISSNIPVTKKINSNVKGVYLAKDDGKDSDSSSGSSSSGSSGGSTSGSSGSSDSSGKSTKIETKTSDSKTKVEVKETKVKTEFIQNGVKVKFELENGKVKIKVTDKTGKELEAKDAAEAKKEAENEIENEGIKIATGGAQVAVAKNNVGAVSSFPLSINLATKQLVVTTPAGTKTVAVLPDQAVANMLNQGVISALANTTSSVGGIPATTKLKERNGVLVYEVDGVRIRKLLGLIPINTPVKTFVSAENGSLVETEQSLLTSILNRLSF